MSCICLCKDTNFKANHNLLLAWFIVLISCICLCKDTNFKANHNLPFFMESFGQVVYAYAKILILKQITTDVHKKIHEDRLYMPMQRY